MVLAGQDSTVATEPSRRDQSDGSIGAGDGTTVELRQLRRRFGATRALDGLSLTVGAGEFVALLGPSGCGKTTALRVLAGFETLDSGQVFVNGEDVSKVPAQKRDMGMVFQSYSLFPNMNALDNVAFGLRMRRQSASLRRAKAESVLELVGLSSEMKKYPHQMSGGQQQRVALARALAIEPRVLLLDEPLSALDAKVRLQLRQQIRSIQQRLQITTVFVTHDQEEALSMADRVCVMRAGQIEQVDAPSVLYSHPATPFVAEFVGSMNRLPGVIASGGPGGQAQVQVLGQSLAVQDSAGSPASVGKAVDVLVRPEAMALASVGHGPGILTEKTFLGATTRLTVLLDQAGLPGQPGEQVPVLVDQPSSQAAILDLGLAVELAITSESVLVAERL